MNIRNQHTQYILSAAEMRAVELHTIQQLGISGLDLMARAGSESGRVLLENYSLEKSDKIFVVCGSGNNGADGFFAARYLHREKRQVKVFFIGAAARQSADAREARRLLEADGIAIAETLPELAELRQATILVDALFGTGFRGIVRDPEAKVILAMNLADRPIVSLDIPSGVGADGFTVPDLYVHASLTVAFGFAKLSQVIEPTRSLMARLEIVDIGFPAEAIQCLPRSARLLTSATAPLHLLQRKPHSHKWNYGHVLVIGGSKGMYGAPVLAAQAALFAGAGLVSLVLVGSEAEIVPAILPEIMVHRIIDKRGYFDVEHLSAVKEIIAAKKVSVLVLGMGLGAAPPTVEFTRGILAMVDLMTILDADGLRGLTGDGKVVQRKNLIVTPHSGEYRDRFGKGTLLEAVDQPIAKLRDFATSEGLTVVHKSSTTLIADAKGGIFINTSGNPGMATAGMGDTLAGIIGAFGAQGLEPIEAASLGVYLHGAAGDLCTAENGEIGVTATGVAVRVGATLRNLLNAGR